MPEKQIVPFEIKQASPTELAVKWQDGHESLYPCFELRKLCRCANCVDEWTGAPRINPADIREDIAPQQIVGVGRYGIRIDWNDGHNTGIYTFTYLREICPCSLCQKKESQKGVS